VNWRTYQAQVSALFRAAGCNAEVEKLVEGVRGKHKVDVYVTFDQYGIRCSWIIECKFWKRSVTKEKVMALGGIVADCGADRGIIVSRRGFQSGAIRAANKTNITLTSIEDLQLYISEKTDELETLRERLAEAESQLDDAENELSEYRCPDCGSKLVARQEVWFDDNNAGEIEVFECGREIGGHLDRPCPSGQDFPALDEYDLTIFASGSEPHWKFQCYAAPKTARARRVTLDIGHGRTIDEAREWVIEHYRYLTTPPGQEFRGKWRSRSGYSAP